MSENVNLLIEKIKEIQLSGDNGWHLSTRSSDTGIGKTFEDLLGKEEDNLDEADFFDIEIKSRRKFSSAMITLFTKSPDSPKGVNTVLREKYGYGNPKTLHATVPSNRASFNSFSKHWFQIVVDREANEIKLLISDEDNNLVDDTVTWNFKTIEDKLEKKIKTTAIVSAEEKKESGKTYFKYVQVELMTGLTIERFLNAIEEGHMFVDIRLGVYKTGKNQGKTHDHGTGFRIKAEHLLKYADIVKLDI